MRRTRSRSTLDCADICATTARVLSRHTGYDANISRTLLQACATACKSCGDECAGHADKHRRAVPAPCGRRG
ncbi:four-helix bundle copper-binding protein [Micromonospora gifhornensis]|uniref:four-helix bundle copper-binding protein n=1 Tax=Micromonospora gifhornensis TaxID=84594 RepID=UPI003646BB07